MNAGILTPLALPEHAAAARAICDVLTLGTEEAFAGLGIILRAKLGPAERVWLAWGVLRACDDAEAEENAADVLDGAGAPLPLFLNVEDDAAWWAELASPRELKAYGVACFLRLNSADQVKFARFAERRAFGQRRTAA